MTMQIAVLGSIFKHSLPVQFCNLYIILFCFQRILLYTDQIVHYNFLDLYRF